MNKQIKFCGFTREEDIKNAVELGVDAIGLVFYPPSPRSVTVDRARELVKIIPAFTSIVALVVNSSLSEIQDISRAVPFDILQFHGDETPFECSSIAKVINKRWIKALRVSVDNESMKSIQSQVTEYANMGASAILLDAYNKEKYGGTGDRFDWSLIPKEADLPIVLAGGLTVNNVQQALKLPISGIDVSGGIESEKGVKDMIKMTQFLQQIRTV